MDKLCSLNQDLLSTLKNTSVIQKMETWPDNCTQPWDNLVQKPEKSSAQTSQAVTTTQPPLTRTTVMGTVTMVTTREQIPVKHDWEECLPLPPPKKRQITVDSEIRKICYVVGTWIHGSLQEANRSPATSQAGRGRAPWTPSCLPLRRPLFKSWPLAPVGECTWLGKRQSDYFLLSGTCG